MNGLADVSQLPRKLAEQVGRELEPGERIVWLGQPIPGRFVRKSLPAVLFGIPWTAFALFWTAGASGFHMPDFKHGPGLFAFFPLFGVPFILIGFGMLSSPLFMRRQALRTVYVLTDRRALLIDGKGWRSSVVRSFAPDQLRDLRRNQREDGSGDIIMAREWKGSQGEQSATDYGFLAIRDAREVELLVKKLAAGAVATAK